MDKDSLSLDFYNMIDRWMKFSEWKGRLEHDKSPISHAQDLIPVSYRSQATCIYMCKTQALISDRRELMLLIF